jgi:hypothetical protein
MMTQHAGKVNEMARTIKRRLQLVILAAAAGFILSALTAPGAMAFQTWAEKLGYPKNKRLLILHAANMGMCFEANEAGKQALENGWVQSASVMPTCPWFNEFARWCNQHPDHDVGVSLTMNSEWPHYRWTPLSPRTAVPGMVDSDGYLWRTVLQFSINAHSDEVRREIDAQIQRALVEGIRPTHLLPHLGALLARPELAAAYFETAQRLWIPAVVVELTPAHIVQFRQQGMPMDEHMIELIAHYPLPKVDELRFMPMDQSYDGKRQRFYQLVRSLPPGITQIVAHPAVESNALKSITDDWQQRVWDAQLLADPDVHRFFLQEGILFTSWKEIMHRFEGNPVSDGKPAVEAGGPSGAAGPSDRPAAAARETSERDG